jgi:hypothetical protein
MHDPSRDGCEAMRRRKLRVYEPYSAAMTTLGLDYVLAPWSCWGREHPDTSALLISLSRRAAKRVGAEDWHCILADFRADASAVLVRRAVCMWRQCMTGTDHPTASPAGGDAAARGGA